ncbi:retrovirus-related pol polyprotein from transposon TNT 1-94 [Tanacetum coccineum]
MFDEYFNPPSIVVTPIQEAAASRAAVLADSLVSTSIDQDAPSTSIPSTQEQEHSSTISKDEFGGVLKNKARLVAQGFRQEEGIDFEESFAPVARIEDNLSHVYKLKKALYGLKQAPRAWYDMLSSFLISQNFSQGTIDSTLFTWQAGNDLLLVQIYVDDIIFASTNTSMCNEFANQMTTKFKMSMMGQMLFFLGLQISQSPRGIFINQSKYAFKIVKKYGMLTSDSVDTPMVEKSKLLLMCSDSDMSLTAYADANRVGCQDTRRSTSRSAQFLDYGVQFNKIPLYCDNKSVISLCSNNVQHSQAKRNDVRYHFIKDQVKNGIVELYFVQTEYQLADIFTKPLSRDRFNFLIEKLVSVIMSSITAQQTKLDLELVPNEKRLKIGKCNRRLNPGKIQREPTFQFVLDALALTPCYSAFLITADFLEGQDLDALPTDEEIMSFLRELGHTREINSLNDVVVDQMHQPWRTFAALINRSLSGKTTGLDKLRLSRAQILWGMYHQKNVDYVELLWEDFIYQIDNRAYKKQEKMYYPRFTKVIIHYFLTQDKTVSWRNKIGMHTSKDDYLINTLRFVSAKEATQIYGAILPESLTSPEMKETKAYKTYLGFATGATPPKKARKFKKLAFPQLTTVPVSPEEPTGKSKRVKRPTKKSTKAATRGVVIRETLEMPLSKKKETMTIEKHKGIDLLCEVELTKEAQYKEVRRKSLIDFHTTHPSGSGMVTKTAPVLPQSNPSITLKKLVLTRVLNDQENDNDDDKTQLDNENKSNYEHETDENESSSESDQEENEEDKEDDEKNRVSALEKDVSELKKDYPLKTQVTALVDEYLDTRLGATRDEFMNHLSVSITARITDQVKIQLPQILPKEVSNFAPPEIQRMVTKTLELAILAKESSQSQSSYEATKMLTEFELKKILIDKIDKNRGLKKRKTSKDAEPTKGPKAKESQFGSSKGTKSQPKSFGKSVQAEEPEFEVADSDMPRDQDENLGKYDEEPKGKTPQQGPTQNWLMTLIASTDKSLKSFNELMSTPIEFYAYIMNGLKIINLTQETLLGPAFRLLKGTRSNYSEIGYNFEEMLQRLFKKKHDLEIQKATKAAQYDLPGIEDMVLNIWVPVKVSYDKHAFWGILHWREQQRYGYLKECSKRADNDLTDSRRRHSTSSNNDIEDMHLLVVHQNRRDLPRDIPLDSVEVLRYEKGVKFNTTAGNPVKEILLKLNLPDHRSILTDLKEYIKMDMEVPGSSRLTRFIATCSYSTDIYKDIMKAQLSYQEKYEHVGPKSQDHKMARLQDDVKRLCLVDDLKKFKITFISSQRYKSKPNVNDHYINSQVKD